MDWLKSLFEFANGFLAAPLGQSILLVLVVAIAGFFLRTWSSDRLETKKLDIQESRDSRESALETLRLNKEAKENERRAVTDTKIANSLTALTSIAGRLESYYVENNELLLDTKKLIELTQTDVRSGFITTNRHITKLASKIDSAASANTSQIRSIGLTQNASRSALDTISANLRHVMQEVKELRTDFGKHADTPIDDTRWSILESTITRISESVDRLNKRRDPSKPDVNVPSTVNKPLPKTDPLSPPEQTIIPAQSGYAIPRTPVDIDKHDTRPLPVTRQPPEPPHA